MYSLKYFIVGKMWKITWSHLTYQKCILKRSYWPEILAPSLWQPYFLISIILTNRWRVSDPPPKKKKKKNEEKVISGTLWVNLRKRKPEDKLVPELPLVHLRFICLPKYFILRRQHDEVIFRRYDNINVLVTQLDNAFWIICQCHWFWRLAEGQKYW